MVINKLYKYQYIVFYREIVTYKYHNLMKAHGRVGKGDKLQLDLKTT